jgi:hypothetical protein
MRVLCFTPRFKMGQTASHPDLKWERLSHFKSSMCVCVCVCVCVSVNLGQHTDLDLSWTRASRRLSFSRKTLCPGEGECERAKY